MCQHYYKEIKDTTTNKNLLLSIQTRTHNANAYEVSRTEYIQMNPLNDTT